MGNIQSIRRHQPEYQFESRQRRGSGKGEYTCERCHTRFTTQQQQLLHVHMLHSPQTCLECEQTFYGARAYATHEHSKWGMPPPPTEFNHDNDTARCVCCSKWIPASRYRHHTKKHSRKGEQRDVFQRQGRSEKKGGKKFCMDIRPSYEQHPLVKRDSKVNPAENIDKYSIWKVAS